MLDLIVMGPDPGQRWRRSIPADRVTRLGRGVRNGWAVPWDLQISREHCDLEVRGDRVVIRCLERATNPAYYKGEAAREITVGAGDAFRIGSTRFRVDSVEPTRTNTVVEERCYRREDLHHARFNAADQRLDVLSALPDAVSESLSDDAFAQRMVRILLDGISRADAAAVVQYHGESSDGDGPAVMRWDVRSDNIGAFHPSRRLIRRALEHGETILHSWRGASEDARAYTMSVGLDWAYCTPILGKASPGWCLYVAGRADRLSGEDDLAGDVRFTELLAQVTSAIREVRQLERQQTSLCQFFSPTVVEAVTDVSAGDILAPRECDITVLFCDLRGFSRTAERLQNDLPNLLARCSEALGLMTERIFEAQGVIADFQGDAALGFWGWPIGGVDGRASACRAALAIDAAFRAARRAPDHPLADFRVGIGVAHGRAIAGKIGTKDQAKVGVLGSVANRGSRLEGMTKSMGVPILLDDEAAAGARRAGHNCRALGRVRPYGHGESILLHELRPDDAELSDDHLEHFERAIAHIEGGRWSEAKPLLEACPVGDGASAFMLRLLAAHGDRPPPDWDGVIEMPSK
jgi:adenylate cyclase